MAHLTAVACDAADPARLAAFWAALLGAEVRADAAGPLVIGPATQVGLRFTASDSPRTGNAMHLHVTSEGSTQDTVVARALDLGASHHDVGQRPEEKHVVLADPEGNEFCVIEPTNGYLAGCGPLGEVACDGTRDVGVFWSAVLGWPLVWDEDEETAVQHPDGGTKVAWGGPPVEQISGRPPQRFELSADDLEAEGLRLTALGATRIGPGRFADPDGREFSLALSSDPARRH